MVLDHRFHQTEAIRSALSVVAYPFQLTANLPATFGTWLSDQLASQHSLQKRNKQLERENLILRSELQQFEALRSENERLRDLLGSSYKVGNRVLVAELLGVDLDPYRQQVMIDKGNTSAVFEGQVVLDANAVMGQVIHVTPQTATVLLITDPNHSLPVQVLRNGLRTIAAGSGQVNQLELPYLPNNADIEAGDLLVTSGLGKKFPAGYPVAKVVEVLTEPGKPFARVVAEPLAKLDRSREVLLVWEINLPPTTPVETPAEDNGTAIPATTEEPSP